MSTAIKSISATTSVATIDVESLPNEHRALLAKLVESAGKQLTKGLEGKDARCPQGSHSGAVTLRIEGEVIVSADAVVKAKVAEQVEVTLAEIVAAQIGPKKIANWMLQGANAVKEQRKRKAGREELAESAGAVAEILAATAKKCGLVTEVRTPAGTKHGAQRCEPRIAVTEFTAA
ncbi:MAG: hypothetical protein KF684_04160 [Phycisphaeraceae bacterium]|nr:hypothetical protein [Phycisphaeraceae bacterium]